MVYDPEEKESAEDQMKRYGKDVEAVARRLAQLQATKSNIDEFFEDTLMGMVRDLEVTSKNLEGKQS